MNDLYKGIILFVMINVCAFIAYWGISDIKQEIKKNKQYVHELQTKTAQCNKVYYPYIVTSSENDFCLCANSSTVLWRKDIK